MDLRIATFNMENLFTRPSAMAAGAGAKGQQAIDDHAELNNLIAKDSYSDQDKARLLELEKRYRFADLNQPPSALVRLNKIRGQLFKRTQAGVKSVVATGRASWTGWFELKTDDVKWSATYNTGRVIAEANADILICIEVENRPTLQRFNEQVLKAEFNCEYAHAMVIDGNDQRGIDVGILSRYPISGMRSHVDARNPGGERTFSRDSPEYVIEVTEGLHVVVIPNHFKSKRGGDSAPMKKRRLAQASAASAIAKNALQVSPFVLLGGDLNDTPDSAALRPLFLDGFQDVRTHASYPKTRPGTYGTGTAANKIDYLILSAGLRGKLVATGLERRGSYHPTLWAPFDTVKSAADEASDHHLLWADFSL
jgi:endonuclease/exonuclease/phosphatase family metal-dependent hydrolase